MCIRDRMQSISAIQYMHTSDVLHRDLKLGNMMMDVEMNVKIGDFGLAAELQFDGERKRTICGTPNYIAPEILQGATCLLYTSDAADDLLCVDLGGRRIIKKKKEIDYPL
eukprot:TRINITY_DN14928_c0_g1_i1.p1 TRINITY_DN14928_c0_g1~~TRINITY_DN14928_c0_g1_i1.p1  ORF type:complete len:110 (+),score=67.17 TRINITY_DN14928_c0_g1_i1:130-459(+)